MSPLSTLIRTPNPEARRLASSEISSTRLATWRGGAIHLAAFGLFLLSLLLIFYRLGERDLWSSHEARAAQNATSVLEGNWLIPGLFDGRLELQKPPLYYWLIAFWCRCTDRPVDELAVRMPSALSALLIVLSLLSIGYVESRPIVSVLAASLLLLMPHFLWQTHVGRIDMPLTAVLSVALGSWVIYTQHACQPLSQYLSLILCTLALAAGVLLKGPLAVILFSLVSGSDALLSVYLHHGTGPLHDVKRRLIAWRPSALGILSVLVASSPALMWYIAANEHTQGQWVREFIFRHNWARGLGGDLQLDRHSHGLGPVYYIFRLPFSIGPIVLLIPWCIGLLPQYIREDKLLRFSLCWFLAPLVFFSLMRYKRIDYVLVAYPGLALFMSSVLVRYWESLPKKAQRYYPIVWLGILVLGSVLWFAYLSLIVPVLDSARQQRDFAKLVRSYARQMPLIMYNTEAHLLTYRVGKPVHRTFDEKELQQWLDYIPAAYVIVPERHLEEFGQTVGRERSWEVLALAKQLRKPSKLALFAGDDEAPLILVRVVTLGKAERERVAN